jgi:hypothetical protein
MKSSSIFANVGRSILAIALALFIIFWFPSPAFDACFPDNTAFVCSEWPNIFAGLIFIMISYYLGPKSRYHYFPVLIIFSFIGSAQNIRFGGQLLDILYQIQFQAFYYGGVIALLCIVIIKFIKSSWVQSVPNKQINKD